MGGKNMGYVMGPLQMALGAGALATGVGAPLGIPLLAAGAGETIGQGAGGSKGAGMGEMFGGLAGGLGEGGLGLAGMGPLGNMLGTTGAGQGFQGMLGMQPSGGQNLLDLASGKIGGANLDPLIKQGAGDLATYEGLPNAPGYAPVPGATLPTSVAQAGGGGGGFTGMLNQAAPVAKALAPQSQTQPQPPAFKTPIQQAPVAPKGQAPATTVTPTVSQVPQAAGTGGRTSQENYRKLLEQYNSGNMGMG